MWDQRYSEPGYAYGTDPNDFLKAEYHRIPAAGQVLCLAEGEGRNAVFLAKQGYNVTGVDQSKVGLGKAQSLAAENGEKITTVQSDLMEYDLGVDRWDGVVSISAHIPKPQREELHRRVVAAMKSGGVLILEAYTPRQLEMAGIGGPPASQRERFMSFADLKNELADLDFIIGRETEREMVEGKYHVGTCAVVQVVARKP